MKRKYVAILLVVALVLTMAACGKENTPITEADEDVVIEDETEDEEDVESEDAEADDTGSLDLGESGIDPAQLPDGFPTVVFLGDDFEFDLTRKNSIHIFKEAGFLVTMQTYDTFEVLTDENDVNLSTGYTLSTSGMTDDEISEVTHSLDEDFTIENWDYIPKKLYVRSIKMFGNSTEWNFGGIGSGTSFDDVKVILGEPTEANENLYHDGAEDGAEYKYNFKMDNGVGLRINISGEMSRGVRSIHIMIDEPIEIE